MTICLGFITFVIILDGKDMFEKEITFDRFVRGVMICLGVLALIYAIGYLSSVLIPFFVAWFVAYLIFPVVFFFQYKVHLHSRILSIIVTLFLIVGVLYGLVALAAPSVGHELSQFKEEVVESFNRTSYNSSIPPVVQRFVQHHFQNWNLDFLVSRSDFIEMLRDYVPRLWSLIYETANVLIGIIASLVGVLYLFFILYDYEKLYNGFIRLFPSSRRPFVKDLASDLSQGMSRYFRGQALISLCVGILFSIGFLLIGFPLAIPIGIFIGILSLIPYMHAFGLIPILLFSLIKASGTGQNFWVILFSALLVFLCVQIIQDTILTPRIMGKAVGLPPFLILLSLSVWGYLLGIIGMIIALPLTTLIISYYKRYVSKE